MSLNRFFRSNSSKPGTRRRNLFAEFTTIEQLEERIVLSADPLMPGGDYSDGGDGGDVDGSMPDSGYPEDGYDGGDGDGSDGDNGGYDPNPPGGDGGDSGDGGGYDPNPPGGGDGFDWDSLTPDVDYVPNSIIVKVNQDNVAAANAYAASIGVVETRDIGLGYEDWILGDAVVSDFYQEMTSSVMFDEVEVNYLQQLTVIDSPQAIPNDPGYVDLYGMDIIQAPEAWEITTGSMNTLIGIVDSGVDYTHPDLYLNIWINPGEIAHLTIDSTPDGDPTRVTFEDLNATSNLNDAALDLVDRNGNGYIDGGDLLASPVWEDGVDGDTNGRIDDLVGWDFSEDDNDPQDTSVPAGGHGTHVAGTVGARGNNSVGVTGVSQRVSLVPLKASLDASGGLPQAAIIGATNYAADLRGSGMIATNNSYGGFFPSSASRNAIANQRDKGQLFVAAAGNSALDNDVIGFYPASYDVSNIISVAASNESDNRANFSQWGKTTVDIAAPGVQILSTVPDRVSPTGYARFDGTSMASPMVAGAVALLFSNDSTLSSTEIQTSIYAGADRLPQWEDLVATGARLNVFKSLDPTTVSFTPVNVATLEGNVGDSNLITFQFDLSGLALTSDFSFDVSTVDGTATGGTDYESITNQTVTFTAGGATTQTVDVKIIGDVFFEGDETFTLDISNAPLNIAFNDLQGIGTITDDETGLGLAVSEQTVDGYRTQGDFTYTTARDNMLELLRESHAGSGSGAKLQHIWDFQVPAADTVEIAFSAGHTAHNEGFNLEYSTDGGTNWTHITAIGYAAMTPLPIQTFALPNTVTGDVKVRVIDTDSSTADLRQDTVAVDHLYFHTTRAGGTGPAPKAKLEVVNATATEEGMTTATVRITLIDGPETTATVIPVALTGTASTDGSDFTLSDGSALPAGSTIDVTIPANTAFVDVVLTPVNDSVEEDTEFLTFTLDPSFHRPTYQNSGTVEIIDNDRIHNVAYAELTGVSTKTGDFKDTWVLGDGKEEMLTERPINLTQSDLEHAYRFTLPNSGSSTFNFDLTASHIAAVGDVDNFDFEISLDEGLTWTKLLDVTSATPVSQTTVIDLKTLPGSENALTTFEALVRVIDTDSSVGDTGLSGVKIDHMQFQRAFANTMSTSGSGGGSGSSSTTASTSSNGSSSFEDQSGVDAYWQMQSSGSSEDGSSSTGSDSGSTNPTPSSGFDGGGSGTSGSSDEVDGVFESEDWFDDLYAAI